MDHIDGLYCFHLKFGEQVDVIYVFLLLALGQCIMLGYSCMLPSNSGGSSSYLLGLVSIAPPLKSDATFEFGKSLKFPLPKGIAK